MLVKLGTSADKPNKINKTFNWIKSLDAHLKDDCSIIEPVFMFSATTPEVIRAGYINAFGYNYFIKNITYSRGRIEVQCHLDVLSSFKTEILTSKAHFVRCSTYNKWINDPMITVYDTYHTRTTKIGQPVPTTNTELYLVTIGG